MFQKANHIIRRISALVLLAGLFLTSNAQTQVNIFELMDRSDLRIDEVEKIAEQYFKEVGTGRGTGFKQYSRWLYERKFHIDENGYYIKPEVENAAYKKFMSLQKKNKLTNVTWSEMGPKSWTYTSGWNPGVGRITSVAVNPADTTVIYVSSPGGGIWKSTNSGSTWTPLLDNTSNSWMSVMHICMDPGNASVLYASPGAVIKTTNGGLNWAATGSGPSTSKKVVVHPSNSNIIFSAATNGLWRSTNAGTSWTQVNTASTEDIEFNPSNPNIMYASGPSGTSCVWRSTDNGVTWTAIGSASGITATGRTLISVSAANPAIVYAVQASGSLFGRFYKSTDTGKTYTTTITGSPAAGTNFFGYETNGTGTSGQATYDMAMTVNPANANEVYIAGIICWVSTNGGTSFTAQTAWYYPNSYGYNHADVHALEWVGKTIYSGSDGGVYKSVNKGGDWIDLSSGLGIRQFYRISCSKTDGNVITGGAQDNGSVFRRTNGNWYDWLGADGMDNAISPTNAAIAIGTSQYGAIYKTTNSGASYSNLSQPANGNWVTPLVMHPTSHDTIWGGWTGIWRSSNGGTSWTNISSGVITGMLTAIAVAPSNTKYIYGNIGAVLYRTSDGGATWSSVTAAASITSIFVSQTNPSKIWITCNSTSNRVFVSTDMGTTFTNLSSGLPAMAARSIVVQNNADEGTYVGMNVGVYYRDNSNPTWIAYGTGLPLVAINEVEIQESTGKLRIATYGRGVWETDVQNSAVCQLPTALNTTNIGLNSVQVNWTAASNGVNYTVEYKLTSSSTWTGTTTTSNTSLTLSGLSAGSAYDWRVRTNCSVNNSAYEQSTFTTQTPCATPGGLTTGSITLSSASASWNAVSGAQSYVFEYKESSSSTWTGTTTTSNTNVSMSGLTSSTAYDWRVKTNCTLDSSGFAQASFTTAANCTSPGGLTTGSITSSSATASWNAASGALSYVFEYKEASSSTWTGTTTTTGTSVNLSGLNSSTAYDWRVKTNCTFDSSGFVQSSFTTTANCQIPGSPTVTNLTSSSATVGWSAVSGASGYVVEYKLSTSSTWTAMSSTTNTSQTITGLSAGLYNWRVYTECGAVNSGYLTSSFKIYCAAKGNSTASEYIDYVALGTIVRSSGSDAGYYNGTALSTNLKPGLSYTITLSPGYPGTRRTEYFRVYIDYNNNGVFTETNELVGSKSTKSAGNTSITFTVPSTATLGSTRMRVLMKYNALPTSCETFANGEVEDYTVVLTNTPSVQSDLQDETLHTDLVVYPVPTDQRLNYTYTSLNEQTEATILIYDIGGKVVYSDKTTFEKGTTVGQMDLNHLNNGIYYFSIQTSHGIMNRKFIILK